MENAQEYRKSKYYIYLESTYIHYSPRKMLLKYNKHVLQTFREQVKKSQLNRSGLSSGIRTMTEALRRCKGIVSKMWVRLDTNTLRRKIPKRLLTQHKQG